MLVSNNNNLLNILLPNDNKVLKDALKNADAQTLESLKKGTTSVKDILSNLFTDLKTADKNNTTIENILKNSNMFKELGSFPKSISTLLTQIQADENLSKYKPLLQSFLKDISTLDDKGLKDLMSKSGVFLESKALEQLKTSTTLPKELETILNQIKTVLKDIPSLDAKKVETLIDKILQNNTKAVGNNISTQNQTSILQSQNNNDLKNLVSQLQNLSKNIGDKQLASLTTLTNSLKNISSQAQLIESKISNSISSPVQNSSPQGNITQVQNLQGNQAVPNQQGNQVAAQQQTSIQNTQEALQKVVTSLFDNINQLKVEIQANKNIPNTQNIIKQIDTLIQNKDLLLKPENLIQVKTLLAQLTNIPELKNNNFQNSPISNLLTNIKSQNEAITQLSSSFIQNTQTNTQINTLTTQQGQTNQLNNELLQAKQTINTKAIETLTQLKSELLNNQNIPNSQNIVKQIDTILQSNDLFSKNNSLIEPKALLNQLTNLIDLKTASNQSSNIASLVSNLKNQNENISSLETKLLQNQNISVEKQQVTKDIQQTLSSLKTELSFIQNIDTKGINQIIDRLLNLQNLFTKIEIPLEMKSFQQTLLSSSSSLNSFQSNFSSNINNLILNLKENIIQLSSNNNSSNLQQNIIKSVEKLESILSNVIQNPSIMTDKQLFQNPLQNDMKAVLLQMQSELVNKPDTSSQDTLKLIDKMITQVEYHQLLSIVSNSNNVYIPFIWDMLDEGSIAMKKVDEDKFYCEINLSLKEFGQTQLLLALYDKNKLDLTIYASKESFKQSIRENSTKLKQALNTVELIPVSINIIDLKQEEEKKEKKQANIYKQNQDFGFGVDIRV